MEEYVTIATYGTTPQADIAVGRLRAEGIKARLVDEHVAWIGYSLAVGGVKLQVPERNVESAKRVLATDYSDQL
ncbi:MAG TPA: DUF2007 domain-containing protein [Gammaproteobacteria bacterium]|nr:DUF2007 domain-containing protein [Gammaproteobacteria bacterium]